MQITSKKPISMVLNRNGGTVITARIDFWRATPQGWDLAGSSLFQNVTKKNETHSANLPKGSYTAVLVCRMEESINGVYDFDMLVNGTSVGSDSGNVDTTSNPHDSKFYKNQFVIDVQ
ncbi:MAG: hypothetical protein IPM20_06345 [Gammaproteobacteria bacterium]|nr:hypothetical protein [Gammaproteobacteria bacterium]